MKGLHRMFLQVDEDVWRIAVGDDYLEMPDIETRYSQRIFSRLVSAYSILRLFGDDIRCMKKLSPTKRS